MIIGSATWSKSAATATDENVLTVRDASTAAAFGDDFGRLRVAIGGEGFVCNVETGFVVYLPVLLRAEAQPPGD